MFTHVHINFIKGIISQQQLLVVYFYLFFFFNLTMICLLKRSILPCHPVNFVCICSTLPHCTVVGNSSKLLYIYFWINWGLFFGIIFVGSYEHIIFIVRKNVVVKQFRKVENKYTHTHSQRLLGIMTISIK